MHSRIFCKGKAFNSFSIALTNASKFSYCFPETFSSTQFQINSMLLQSGEFGGKPPNTFRGEPAGGTKFNLLFLMGFFQCKSEVYFYPYNEWHQKNLQ